jgi:hypothetical protein
VSPQHPGHSSPGSRAIWVTSLSHSSHLACLLASADNVHLFIGCRNYLYISLHYNLSNGRQQVSRSAGPQCRPPCPFQTQKAQLLSYNEEKARQVIAVTILLFSVPVVTVMTTRKCFHLAYCKRGRNLFNCSPLCSRILQCDSKLLSEFPWPIIFKPGTIK